MQRRLLCGTLVVALVLGLAACGSDTVTQRPTEAVQPPEPTVSPVSVLLSESTVLPASGQPSEPTVPSFGIVPEAPTQATPTPDKPTIQVPLEQIKYNLPPATLTSPTGLYPSPNRSELIVQAEIRAGETVYVMGRNGTSSHLRVVWGTGVGWVPTSITDYNGRPDRLEPLPVFTREPPRCAIPLTTQFVLSGQWTSDRQQRLAVVVDLFRSQAGVFPPTHLSLTVNGTKIESTRRQIVEHGQFWLKDVVFTLPGYVQQGDRIGYLLETTSDEPLTFVATIFSVPEGCQWDTK